MLQFYLSIIESETDKIKFEELYKKHINFVIYCAYCIVNNKVIAEEIAHECFIQLVIDLDAVEIENVPKTKKYLKTITRRKAIDYLRKNKHESLSPDGDIDIYSSDFNSPEDMAQNNDTYGKLLAHVFNLPIIGREIFLLRCESQMSFAEISKLLDIKEATARKRYERIRHELMAVIEEDKFNET